MSIAGETTRRAKPAFVARTRLAFAAFLAALLGLGLAPQAAYAAALTAHASPTPSAAAEQQHQQERHSDRSQGHSHTEHLGRSPLATAVVGTLPHAPREQHSPGGASGVLPSTGGPAAYPTHALLAGASERAHVPGTAALALPEVRGPPVTAGR